MSGQSVTDYVLCSGADYIFGTFNPKYYINFYDKGFNVISTVIGNSNTRIEVPEMAVYFRGTFANNQPKQAYVDFEELQFYEFGVTRTDLEFDSVNKK